MTIADSVQKARRAFSARGYDLARCLPPGHTAQAISGVEARLGFDLPAELRAFYAVADGVVGLDPDGLVEFRVDRPVCQLVDLSMLRLNALEAACNKVQSVTEEWHQIPDFIPAPVCEGLRGGRWPDLPFLPVAVIEDATMFYGLCPPDRTLQFRAVQDAYYSDWTLPSLEVALLMSARLLETEGAVEPRSYTAIEAFDIVDPSLPPEVGPELVTTLLGDV